ncbi:MAG: hypothetical protein AAF804_15985, partial [Bacteroidota bacterium]
MKTPLFTFVVAVLFALTSCTPESIIEPGENGNLTEGGHKAISIAPVQEELYVDERDHATLSTFRAKSYAESLTQVEALDLDRSIDRFEPSIQAEMFLWSEGVLYRGSKLDLTQEADYWVDTKEPNVELIYEKLNESK